MNPANDTAPFTGQPIYIGANWLGVHKVAIGDQIARFWTEEAAREGMRRIERMRESQPSPSAGGKD